MQSPFSFGRTVQDRNFTNRFKEIQRLKSNFENKVNTTMISPRRWGKSSLVEKVARQVNGKKHKVIILDLMPVRNEEEFYSSFSTAVIKATSGKLEEWMTQAKKVILDPLKYPNLRGIIYFHGGDEKPWVEGINAPNFRLQPKQFPIVS